MDNREFKATARRSENESTITYDVRPFGNRQGEAADWYLHERLAQLEMGAGGFGPRLVVVLCDSKAEIPSSANRWLAGLNAKGAPHEIQRV